MCFTLGGGGSRGDVTQNSYYNRRPWEATDVKPQSLGDQSFASGDIIANNVGWHGSNNRIKILPRDFQADDVGRPVMFEDGTSNERHLISHGSAKAYASVEIPSGFTATHVMVYGSDTGQTHTTYLADVTSKAVTEKGSATALGTEKAITNVTSSTLNYLLIEVSSDGSDDELTGGYVTIIKT